MIGYALLVAAAFLIGAVECRVVSEPMKPVDMCAERGHIQGGAGLVTMTAVCGSSRYVDLPDRTLLIWNDLNTTTYTCGRCGKRITTEPAKPCTTVVWQRLMPDSVYIPEWSRVQYLPDPIMWEIPAKGGRR